MASVHLSRIFYSPSLFPLPTSNPFCLFPLISSITPYSPYFTPPLHRHFITLILIVGGSSQPRTHHLISSPLGARSLTLVPFYRSRNPLILGTRTLSLSLSLTLSPLSLAQ